MAPTIIFKRKEEVEDEFFMVERFRCKNQMKNVKASFTPMRELFYKNL
jgi:hypothetical protein